MAYPCIRAFAAARFGARDDLRLPDAQLLTIYAEHIPSLRAPGTADYGGKCDADAKSMRILLDGSSARAVPRHEAGRTTMLSL